MYDNKKETIAHTSERSANGIWLIVVAVVLSWINGLFLYKYGLRISDCILYVLPLYVSFFLGLVSMIRWTQRQYGMNHRTCLVVYSTILLLLGGLSIWIVNPIELQVDRWSVIASFWEAVFQNDYPYTARSHLGNLPGPMPTYFLVAFPFYVTGTLPLLSVLGYLLLPLWVWFRPKRFHSSMVIWFLILLLGSTSMYWEILTRSNVFTISTLIVLAFDLFNRGGPLGRNRFIWYSILLGLLLATRSVYVLFYMLWALSKLNSGTWSLSQLIWFGSALGIGFFLSFSPLVLYFPLEEFFATNPFRIQSNGLLPLDFILPFFVLPFILSPIARSERLLWLWGGIILFAIIFFYHGYYWYELGWDESVLQSEIDLSYYLFCLPFLLFGIMRKNQKL